MVWFVIAFALTILITVIYHLASDPYDSYRVGTAGVFFGWLVGLTVAALMFQSVAFYIYSEPQERYQSLVNLGDGAGVKGRFFLGTGSIDTSPVYMYYVEENGQYRLRHKQASKSYITYTDSTPQLVYHGKFLDNKWLCWGESQWKVDENGSDDVYEFQVPRGSVKQDFNLDAQ